MSKAAIPELYDWIPTTSDLYYLYNGENVQAEYSSKIGISTENTTLHTFYIKRYHYKSRMDEIVHMLNYFSVFYDYDKETYFSMMTVKYLIDSQLDMPQMDVVNLILERVITPAFVAKCKLMAVHLYTLNINTDSSGKYNNTPKITNAQAYQLVATSFCFKILTPIMLHFSNVNTNFNPRAKTEYLKWFNILFNKVIDRFEEGDTKFYTSLCQFVSFRAEKLYRNNYMAFYQKKMLRGDTVESYTQSLIREVVCVKTLYKLDHRKSSVSFIDGVIHKFNGNYLKENFPSKPYEIDSDETSRDSDETLSNAEVIEMTLYKRDESAAMISDVNSEFMMAQMRRWYGALNISDEEVDFYYDHYKPNEINNWLYKNFFAAKFKSPYAVINLNRRDSIYLHICLKKVLQRQNMPHLAQLVTASVDSLYKVNTIRNTRFLERVTSSKLYQDLVVSKYSKLLELNLNDNPLLSILPSIINSVYTLNDYDEELHGFVLEHIDADAVANEFVMFLSII